MDDPEFIAFLQKTVEFFSSRLVANSSEYHVLFTKDEIQQICTKLEIFLAGSDHDYS